MQVFRPDLAVKHRLPLFLSSVRAGFPSPAEDYIEGKLDLNEHLVRRPAATFLVRAVGDSMIGAGIYPNDILIVDRSITPRHGSIVIAVINGELTVKRLNVRGNQRLLEAANPSYEAIRITQDMDLWCWGVVTSAIHQFTSSAKSTGSKKPHIT